MKHHLNDMLCRIKNGQKSKLNNIFLYDPVPKFCINVLDVLQKEGFIRGYKKVYNEKTKRVQIKVLLKYGDEGKPVINHVENLSTSGKRFYSGIKPLWKMNSGLEVTFISTPKGIMTDFTARAINCGGEVLFNIS